MDNQVQYGVTILSEDVAFVYILPPNDIQIILTEGYPSLRHTDDLLERSDICSLLILPDISYMSLYNKPIMSSISYITFGNDFCNSTNSVFGFPPNITNVRFDDLRIIANNISYIVSWPTTIQYEYTHAKGYDIIINNFIDVVKQINTTIPFPIYEEIIFHLSVDEDDYDDIFIFDK